MLEFSVDAAVLIRDFFFGIDSVSSVHIRHHSAEHSYKGEAAVLYILQLSRGRRPTILSAKH